MSVQSNDNVIDLLKIFEKCADVPPPNTMNSATLQTALNMLAHAQNSGWVMVPGTATPEMIRAARTVTHLPAEELQKIWHAMLQAW